jgi:hypothetical protein
LIPATQFRGAGFYIDAKMSHISGFVQVGKAAPIGFRLVVGLRQQVDVLIQPTWRRFAEFRALGKQRPRGCSAVLKYGFDV